LRDSYAEKHTELIDSYQGDVAKEDLTSVFASEQSDSVSYSFELRANGWGLPDGKDPEKQKELEILKLLQSLYVADNQSAVDNIDGLLNAENIDRAEVIKDLAKDLVEDYEVRIDNLKNEISLFDNEKQELTNKIDSLSNDLKDSYIEKIISLSDKADPELNIDELKDELKNESVDTLKSNLLVVNKLFKKDTQVTQQNNESHSFSDTGDSKFNLEDIEKLKKTADIQYAKMYGSNPKGADAYRARMNKIIAEQEKQLQSQNNTDDN